MVWKGWDFFPHGTRIDFMRYKGLCLIASLIAMVISLGLFVVPGLNYGIDFKGGTLVEIGSRSGPADIGGIRAKLNSLGLGDVQVQEFGTPEDVLIRVEGQAGGEKADQAVVDKIKGALGDSVDYRRTEVVGPAVSSELRTTGIIAVLVSILVICAYVWFRFEWQFAAGVVLALFHDVLTTVGVFAITQIEFDLSVVAALLTIVGYSVNDSVVVSDRIRENLRKYKKMPMTELLNLSVNETLSRTILTSSFTAIVLIALIFLGGAVIRPFAFAILFGIAVGTYSSIFVAAPLLDYLHVKRDWSQSGAGKRERAKPAV
ncbi:MAG: protein translocase subunit SecF [Hyphomicrobiaceae bacterium]